MKLGRNDPCWCGSGRKYKVCHERMDERIESYRLEGHIVPGPEQIKNEEISDSFYVALTKTYEATPSNQMTFAATSLTASAGTFTGLVAGEQLTVTGSTTGSAS